MRWIRAGLAPPSSSALATAIAPRAVNEAARLVLLATREAVRRRSTSLLSSLAPARKRLRIEWRTLLENEDLGFAELSHPRIGFGDDIAAPGVDLIDRGRRQQRFAGTLFPQSGANAAGVEGAKL